MPLWMAMLDALRPAGAPLTPRIIIGLVIGFFGVALLIGPGEFLGGQPVHTLGALVLLGAALSWSIGTVYGRSTRGRSTPLQETMMRLLTGGGFLLLGSFIFGEGQRFDPTAVSLRSLLSLGYLVVFGSIVTFSAFTWLLSHMNPARLGTYAYVNPVVALLIGWGIGSRADEPAHPGDRSSRPLVGGARPQETEVRADRGLPHRGRRRRRLPTTYRIKGGLTMIARIWHGFTPTSKADAYNKIVETTGIHDLRKTEGNRGAWTFRRIEGDVAHFIVLSMWDGMESIKRFAGPEPQKSVLLPGGRRLPPRPLPERRALRGGGRRARLARRLHEEVAMNRRWPARLDVDDRPVATTLISGAAIVALMLLSACAAEPTGGDSGAGRPCEAQPRPGRLCRRALR